MLILKGFRGVIYDMKRLFQRMILGYDYFDIHQPTYRMRDRMINVLEKYKEKNDCLFNVSIEYIEDFCTETMTKEQMNL